MVLCISLVCCSNKADCQKGYDKWIVRAHKKAGVIFIGSPEYIDSHSHLDPSGGLTIMGGSYFY